MEALDPALVHQTNGVHGHVGEPVGTPRLVAGAGVAVVEEDDAMAAGELGAHEVPPLMITPEPHQEDDGLARTLLVVKQLELTDARPRHGGEVWAASPAQVNPRSSIAAPGC